MMLVVGSNRMRILIHVKLNSTVLNCICHFAFTEPITLTLLILALLILTLQKQHYHYHSYSNKHSVLERSALLFPTTPRHSTLLHSSDCDLIANATIDYRVDISSNLISFYQCNRRYPTLFNIITRRDGIKNLITQYHLPIQI